MMLSIGQVDQVCVKLDMEEYTGGYEVLAEKFLAA